MNKFIIDKSRQKMINIADIQKIEILDAGLAAAVKGKDREILYQSTNKDTLQGVFSRIALFLANPKRTVLDLSYFMDEGDLKNPTRLDDRLKKLVKDIDQVAEDFYWLEENYLSFIDTDDHIKEKYRNITLGTATVKDNLKDVLKYFDY